MNLCEQIQLLQFMCPLAHLLKTTSMTALAPFVTYRFRGLLFHGLFAGLVFVLMTSTTLAQNPRSTREGNQAGNVPGDLPGGKRVSINRRVEHAFRIEPVVQRFKARRGEVIPFTFQVTSTGKTMQVDVSPVQLRQEETGIILHDEHSPPMDGVRFSTPTRFTLNAGETVELKGTVTVPLTKTNYLSFGLLVRDHGVIKENETTDAPAAATQASIRYVTQYVLRVDIETGVVDTSGMDQLVLENATIISKDGMPYVQAYVHNPSDFALECRVRSELAQSNTSGTRHRSTLDPVSLFMPARANLNDDDKYLVRMMPHARLRLEAPLETTFINGAYDLSLQVSNGRRTMKERVFQQNLMADRFRALDTKIASLGPGVTLEPAQIELGRVEGTQRMITLQVSNHSESDQQIHLVPRDHLGDPIQRLMLSKSKFEIAAGRTKTIRAMLRGKSDLSAEWGTLDVIRRDLDSPNEVASAAALPLELVHAERPALQVEAGPLQWANLTAGKGFVMELSNHGQGYAPIHAELLLGRDDGSRPHRMLDGFGRWLAPGQKRELQFFVPDDLVAGKYQVRLQVRSRENVTLKEQVVVLQITDEMLGGTNATVIPANSISAINGELESVR